MFHQKASSRCPGGRRGAVPSFGIMEAMRGPCCLRTGPLQKKLQKAESKLAWLHHQGDPEASNDFEAVGFPTSES